MNVMYERINWRKLRKRSPYGWQTELNRATKELFTASDFVELSQYNELGYFHRVDGEEHLKQLKQDWEQLGRVPQEWISKGSFPGIWTAMFDPHNTYSHWHGPIFFVRFYFKPEYFIYDNLNTKHTRMFKEWNGKNKKNPWKKLKNNIGMPLDENMKFREWPSHKGFFEDNKFGALLAYSDYFSPVIMLEDSVEGIEFLETE